MDFSASFCYLLSGGLGVTVPGASFQPPRHRGYQPCSKPTDSSTHSRSPAALSPAAAGSSFTGRRRQLFHRPPPFGVIASLILFLVVVPMWVLQFWNLPSAGLTVDLITSDFPPPATPWPEALILRIDAHNRRYLNAALTSPSALPNDLRTEL